MIPAATKVLEIDTLPDDEEVAFSIGNAAWVMKSLSKLYSNAVLAVVREYSTNARDAHIEAGNKAPIKVRLPELYHPFFEVEDFGVGMSEKELKEVYTKFGDSTKRNSNDVNGVLGFGCKSALAYTDSFIVVSRKDGLETEAFIARKADWSIGLRVTNRRQTNELNGTKVQIPARDYDAFNKIASDFYRFWEPGTVELNGKEPEWAVGEKLDDHLFFSKNPGTSYVVMGSVAYRIANPDALFNSRKMNSISFVAYVPNGSVEFTPSREDLEYTEQTKKTLHGVIDNFEKKIVVQAKADVDTATGFADAYSKYTYWCNKLGKGPFGDLEFKGVKFVDHIKFDGYRYQPSHMRYNMYGIEKWSVGAMKDTFIVTHMSTGNPSSHHKGRTNKYLNQKGMSVEYILFTSATKVDSVWIDQSRVIDWETVRDETKPPKNPSQPRPKRIRGTFDYWTKDGMVWEKELPDTKELYWITIMRTKNNNIVPQTALRLLDSDAVVVRLAANRINKFRRDNPDAKNFIDEFQKRVNLNGEDFLDKETKEAMAVSHRTKQWIDKLPLDRIHDPEFKRVKRLLDRQKNDSLDAYHNAMALATSMGMRYNFKQYDIHATDDSLMDKYPLTSLVNPRWGLNHLEEFVLYINAKFKASKKPMKGNK